MNAADVAKTLKDQGQEMILTRTILGTFDPVTGTTTAGTNQSWTVYGITKNYKLSSITADNSLILVGDKQAIISFDEVEPLLGDKLTVMGINWTIMAIGELSPQGVALMFYCNVRK